MGGRLRTVEGGKADGSPQDQARIILIESHANHPEDYQEACCSIQRDKERDEVQGKW